MYSKPQQKPAKPKYGKAYVNSVMAWYDYNDIDKYHSFSVDGALDNLYLVFGIKEKPAKEKDFVDDDEF
jgi:hypothetical protein